MYSKSYKYRFYPTEEQKILLTRTFGCCRVVWNQTLTWRLKEYNEHNRSINYNQSSKFLTSLKHHSDFAWLNEVSSIPLVQTLRNQDLAFKQFFKDHKGFPRFKRKGGRQAVKFTKSAFRYVNGTLTMAKCKEPLAVIWSRKLPCHPSSITISKEPSGRYFVSCLCEVLTKRKLAVAKVVGIDLGLTHLAVLSDGEKLKRVNYTKKYKLKLSKTQRNLFKKQKGSKNREKARIKVARCSEKIKNCRADYLHKISKRIINENQIIVLETLNVKGMLKNRCLSKSIADVSWTEFTRQLEYKAKWAGRSVIKIDRWFPSSKKCSTKECDFKHEVLPLHIREWRCPQCKVVHDRDVNAAKNILTAGLAGIVCGV